MARVELKQLHLTQKLRLHDRVPFGSVSGKNVEWYIEHEPLELWNRIHPDKESLNYQTKRYKISLVRTAYQKLKTVVNKSNPDLVKIAEETFINIKSTKKLHKEIKGGKLGTVDSNFKRLNRYKKDSL